MEVPQHGKCRGSFGCIYFGSRRIIFALESTSLASVPLLFDQQLTESSS